MPSKKYHPDRKCKKCWGVHMKTRLSLHLRPRVVYGRYLWHQREAGLFLALMFHFASPLGMFYTAGAAFRGVVVRVETMALIILGGGRGRSHSAPLPPRWRRNRNLHAVCHADASMHPGRGAA